MATEKMSHAHIEYVCDRLHYIPTMNVVGLCNGDTAWATKACILYDNWTPNSVCVHSYIPEPRYLTRGFLTNMFRYPFSHVDFILGVTPGDNAKALAFNKRIGFTEAYRLPSGFARGVDQVFQVMSYKDCRYWRRPE